jgi:hypothetical protein
MKEVLAATHRALPCFAWEPNCFYFRVGRGAIYLHAVLEKREFPTETQSKIAELELRIADFSDSTSSAPQ